jgi:hypothetical protein
MHSIVLLGWRVKIYPIHLPECLDRVATFRL